jgi:general stress protein 26
MAQRERPQMIRYGIAQGEQGMIDWAWVDAQLAKSRNYWISTVTPDGKPHAMPVWGVWHDGALYFGSDRESRKSKNLMANAAVVVHLESGDDAVILEGDAARVTDGDLLDALSKVYGAKYDEYTPDFRNEPDTLIFAVQPRKAFAWKESDFPNTATRWRFGT